jgi:hypothetical protein
MRVRYCHPRTRAAYLPRHGRGSEAGQRGFRLHEMVDMIRMRQTVLMVLVAEIPGVGQRGFRLHETVDMIRMRQTVLMVLVAEIPGGGQRGRRHARTAPRTENTVPIEIMRSGIAFGL